MFTDLPVNAFFENTLYMALVASRDVIGWPLFWSSGLALYYDPGAISMRSSQTLTDCFLERSPDSSLAVHRRGDCSFDPTLIGPALNTLHRQLALLQNNRPENCDALASFHFHPQAYAICRLAYFEPQLEFVVALRHKLVNGLALSHDEINIFRHIAKQAGSPKALATRQHHRWRLMRLRELELIPFDQNLVHQLTLLACSLEGLTPSGQAMIEQLEKRYRFQRRQATLERAKRIAALVDSNKEIDQ